MSACNLPSGSGLAESGGSVQQDGASVLPALPVGGYLLHAIAGYLVYYSLRVFDRNTDRFVSPHSTTLGVSVKGVFALARRAEVSGPRDVPIDEKGNTLTSAITVRTAHGLGW